MRATVNSLLHLAGRGRRPVGLLAVAALLAGTTEGVAILIVVRAAVHLASNGVSVDFLPMVQGPAGSTAALGIAGILAVFTIAAHLFVAREAAEFSAAVLEGARSRTLRAFARATWTRQSLQRAGSLQESLSSLSTQSAILAHILATGAANLLMVTVFIGIGLAVSPVGMLVVAATGLAVLMLLRPWTRRTRQTGTAYTTADSSFNEDVANFASSTMEYRAFGVETAARAELEDRSRLVGGKLRAVRFSASFGATLYRDVAVLLLVFAVGAMTLIDRPLVGGASAVVVLSVRTLASAHAVNAMVHAASERGPTVELLLERIAELERSAESFGSRRLQRFAGLSFHDVGYTYEGGIEALRCVSFEIGRGERVGLAGPSGGGKSTLVQILLRLRRPTVGTVRVNGVDYSEFDERSWASLIAFVPQEPTLLQGTIAHNIAFFRPGVRPDDVRRAAVLANIAREIEQLPSGYDTLLGPGGSGLSGGQKQRVAIARALVAQPAIVVMDEPSSALDAAAESLLSDTIEGLGRETTVVIVAHRPSTLMVCDRVIEIIDGRIASDGRTDPGG